MNVMTTEERSATLPDMPWYVFIVAPPDRTGPADPVGVLEIAPRLDVEDRSVHQWLHRHRLPDADYPSVNGTRAWEWATILWWAGETGRLRTADLVAEYVERFGHQPVAAERTRRMATSAPTAPIVKLVDKHAGLPSKPSVPKLTGTTVKSVASKKAVAKKAVAKKKAAPKKVAPKKVAAR